MQEHSHNFDDVDDASDITLAAPRFDANEAQRADPVVPLHAIRRTRTDKAKPRMMSRHGARRSLPLGLLVVALLGVVAVGGIATKVLRRDRTTQSSTDASVAAPATVIAAPAAPQADVAFDGRNDASANRKSRQPRANPVPRPVQGEESFLPKEVMRRVEEISDGDEGERRVHDERTNKHQRDRDDEKSFRKELKRAKKGARLIDTLIGLR